MKDIYSQNIGRPAIEPPSRPHGDRIVGDTISVHLCLHPPTTLQLYYCSLYILASTTTRLCSF